MGLFSKAPTVNTDEKAVDALLSRGVADVLIKDELRKKLLSGKRLRVKFGIDPTSPHVHIGRAVPLLKLRDFQELGHQIVFIVGDFTAVIGDTSDKDAERPMLSPEQIEENKKTYAAQAGKILDMSKVEFHHNSEWLEKLTYREIGEHANLFSVADFIARDNIRRRLDAGKRVSLREMIYPLMQGYDSVAIKSDVELGGIDQTFNVLAGRPLQERYGQPPQDVLLMPLIDGLDGRKMSSSWGNTIPLTMEANDMFGKVMSMRDESVEQYFELCTRVPMEEVADIMKGHPKDAKMRLAKEITALYHGRDAAQTAEEEFNAVFAEGAVPQDIVEMRVTDSVTDALIASGLVASKSELRRLLEQHAIRTVEGTIIENLETLALPATLRIGKHRFISLAK